MALLVYVDDIVPAGNNADACKQFKTYLDPCFSIKDLGPLIYFMGIDVACGPQGMFFSQRKYVLEIIDECGLLRGKPVDFAMDEAHKVTLATGRVLHDPTRY